MEALILLGPIFRWKNLVSGDLVARTGGRAASAVSKALRCSTRLPPRESTHRDTAAAEARLNAPAESTVRRRRGEVLARGTPSTGKRKRRRGKRYMRSRGKRKRSRGKRKRSRGKRKSY
jgi:hypothetical protein